MHTGMHARFRGPCLVVAAVAALSLLSAACGGGGKVASAALTPDQLAGRQVFLAGAQPACATCHTLREAGSFGTVGANLDVMRPTAAIVSSTVRNGVPPNMPPLANLLTDEQIRQVAAYVSAVAGK